MTELQAAEIIELLRAIKIHLLFITLFTPVGFSVVIWGISILIGKKK